jgi:pyruvate dehydrogenase E2 component (dihydrolipoamide acetyltransferase)
MAVDVPMPKLGLTMEEATIIEWLVADGAAVEADQPIVRIETDKTETEVGSPGRGRLHQIGQVGDVLACGTRIAWLLDDGEGPPGGPGGATAAGAPAARTGDAGPAEAGASAPPARAVGSTPVAVPAAPEAPGRVIASPNARRLAAERGVALRAIRGTGPGGRIVSEDVLTHVPVGSGSIRPDGAHDAPLAVAGGGRVVVASTAARHLADLLGVDLATVPVDPVEHRITRDGVALHVRSLLNRLAAAPAPAPATPPSPGARPVAEMPLLQEPTETIPLRGRRGTIAKRMHASLQEMAQLTLTMDADMTAVLADRAGRTGASVVPSITDYLVAATARALLVHPRLNAQVTAEGIAVLPEVHVGLAVAVEGALLVPVVRDAAHRDLTDLAAETSRLAEATRHGSVTPAELEGGTFSVSALGAFGVDAFTPVINPPNVGILGVGRLRDDVVMTGGEVGTVKRLTLSLTWDHRVVDGVPAAEFCRTIVDLLADPSRLDTPVP